MNICADCAHLSRAANGNVCVRPVPLKSPDVVTGASHFKLRVFCTSERAQPVLLRRDRCGPSGRHFQDVRRAIPLPIEE